jgi:hypothetical protein
MLLGFVMTVVYARNWPDAARLFPWAIGIPMVGFVILQLVVDLTGNFGRSKGNDDNWSGLDLPVDRDVPLSIVLHRAGLMFVWIVGLLGAIWLIGFIVSIPMFAGLYLLIQGKERWPIALTGFVVAGVMEIGLFHMVLHLPWPEGIFPQMQSFILDWIGN